MNNLYAIELGNEPNCELPLNPIQSAVLDELNGTFWAVFSSSDPIANGAAWTAAADYASQDSWQDAVCGNLSTSDIISAGVYFGTSPMSIVGLAAKEGKENSFVKDYCSHNYPQSAPNFNLTTLMSHSGIASQIKHFAPDISAAIAQRKPHVFGETNSGNSPATAVSVNI
jgi:hypothetical protein